MSTSVELVLLKCLRCDTPLPAEEEEVGWACATCGEGQQLTSDGLAPLTVHWALARPGARDLRWLPFWVFTGTVRFDRREIYGTTVFGGGEPDKLWRDRIRFHIPAYPSTLEQMETLGADLTRRQLPLRAGSAMGPISGCTLLPEDARQAAEFVVLTIEADRRDKLKSVEFALDLGEPELWMLPFAGEAEAKHLAVDG